MADARCSVSKGWDFSKESEDSNSTLIEAAPYTSLETFFISIILIVTIVGVIANLVKLFALIRTRDKWDNALFYFPGAHLTCLALADMWYLLGVLIYLLGPLHNSPVSFDSYFNNCWVLTGFLLILQALSAGFTSVIAIDTYADSPLSSATKWKTKVFIVVLAVISLFCAVNYAAFSDDTEKCVIWPQTPEYENYPKTINTCPWKFFLTFRFILFHDVLVFYVPFAIIVFCYWRVIQKKSTAGSNDYIGETVGNLRARIIIYAVCHAIRIVNFAGAFHFDEMGLQLIPEYTVGSEIFVLIFRGLLWLQPALNPFLYFLARESYRPLLWKAVGRPERSE